MRDSGAERMRVWFVVLLITALFSFAGTGRADGGIGGLALSEAAAPSFVPAVLPAEYQLPAEFHHPDSYILIDGRQLLAVGAGILAGIVILDTVIGVPTLVSMVIGGAGGSWFYETTRPSHLKVPPGLGQYVAFTVDP